MFERKRGDLLARANTRISPLVHPISWGEVEEELNRRWYVPPTPVARSLSVRPSLARLGF